jgi:hypothetical protein
MAKFIPQSFTTPITATAAWVYAPLWDDYEHSSWLLIIVSHDLLPLYGSCLLYIADCGGVLPYRIVDS